MLPAHFPNLCNGSSGIAVGMATNIPPHNMREVAEGVHWALDHPDASREELLDNLIRIIKGPDFPTGATILGHKGIEQAYRTGRGLITMRAVVNTEEIKGCMCLVITELPYQVSGSSESCPSAKRARQRIKSIADMRDETSGRTGQRLVLVLKRDAVPKVVLNNLYKHSSCGRPSARTCWHWSTVCHRCISGCVHPSLGKPPARSHRTPLPPTLKRGRGTRPHPAGLSEGP